MQILRGKATSPAILAGIALFASAAALPPADLVHLHANLTGSTEVPGPGDQDGHGRIHLTIDADSGKVCYEATIEGIAHPKQAHVHQGEVGSSGPPVITLTSDLKSDPSGCILTEPAVVADLVEQPSQFYLNVHSAEHPAGAIRGQLALGVGDATP